MNTPFSLTSRHPLFSAFALVAVLAPSECFAEASLEAQSLFASLKGEIVSAHQAMWSDRPAVVAEGDYRRDHWDGEQLRSDYRAVSTLKRGADGAIEHLVYDEHVRLHEADESIRLFMPDRMFALWKEEGRDEFLLATRLFTKPQTDERARLDINRWLRVKRFVDAGLLLYHDIKLYDVLKAETFEVRDCRYVDGEKQILRIEFTASDIKLSDLFEGETDEWTATIRGSIDLNWANNWLLARSLCEHSFRGEGIESSEWVEFRATYGDSEKREVSFPKSISYRVGALDDELSRWRSADVFETKSWRESPMKPEELKLSHYGLPDLLMAPDLTRSDFRLPGGKTPPIKCEARVELKASGPIEERKLLIRLDNTSSGDIRIVGSNASCGTLCVSTPDLPITIRAGSHHDLTLVCSADVYGHHEFELKLYTDAATQPVLFVSVQATLESPTPVEAPR